MEKIKVSFVVNVTDKDIDTIIEIGKKGVLHWCNSLVRLSENTYAVDNKVDTGYHTFTTDDLLYGIRLYVENPTENDFLEFVDHELRIDGNYIEEETADAIIQYATYGDVIYKRGARINS